MNYQSANNDNSIQNQRLTGYWFAVIMAFPRPKVFDIVKGTMFIESVTYGN